MTKAIRGSRIGILGAVVLSFAMLFLAACGSSLSGRYVSESGVYEIEFKSDGSCTWYEVIPDIQEAVKEYDKEGELQYDPDDTYIFYGTYEKTDDGYTLTIDGTAIFNSSGEKINWPTLKDAVLFTATVDGKDLIITGGTVDGERFIKSESE